MDIIQRIIIIVNSTKYRVYTRSTPDSGTYVAEKVASPINKYTTCKNARGDGSAEPLVQGQGGGTNRWPSLPENYLIGLEGMKR